MKSTHGRVVLTSCLTLALLAFACTAALALEPYDVPAVTCGDATLTSLTLHVCGGAVTGAPAGLTIQWKTAADYEATGWADDETLCKLSISGQPSMQHPDKSRWDLLPGECEDILIGDLNLDETGLSAQNCGATALACGTEYVFRWFAHAGRGKGRSDWGGNLSCFTDACPPEQCTFTQGYWKTHGANACHNGNNDVEWPASVIANGMYLGNVLYTADQLCCILNTEVKGNGLYALAHQLISAKLNRANGATNCDGELRTVDQAIAAADNLIGNLVVGALVTPGRKGEPPTLTPGPCGGMGFLNTSVTADHVKELDGYNNGGFCEENCHAGDAAVAPQPNTGKDEEAGSWGQVKGLFR